jgi:glycosyltransferase involved in cell wall biosynthesis
MSALRIALVGPLPPPSGGMANQTKQLAGLLAAEGVRVELVQVNAPYRPAWIASLRGVRAMFRLFPYLLRLWQAAGSVQIMHIMANSGWSWHLFAAPAVWIAWLRGVPPVVNYRGGDAASFFSRAFALVRPTLGRAAAVVVPSRFLAEVFGRYSVPVRIVPNIIDLGRFAVQRAPVPTPHLIVTRNLEPIYDIGTAIRAFALVRQRFPTARMTVAGSGPELDALARLVAELGLGDTVSFAGRIENSDIQALYQSASVMLNPSTIDNMPISILEAWASGVPVVSTNVGGIPFLAEDDRNALLVEPRKPEDMAREAMRVLDSERLATKLAQSGRRAAEEFAWPRVRDQWFAVYSAVLSSVARTARALPSKW